jgi:hypothetical protein
VSVDFYATKVGAARPLNMVDAGLNMGNASARAVLTAMGIIDEGADLWNSDQIEISWFRRGLLLANNTHRPEAQEVPALVEGRLVECGLTAEQIRSRLAELGQWLEDMVARGATHVYWA